ncbi:hypothetical protein NDU88_003148 [Pleurodeles waltl]|uniref:Uncharacterized protein n=1 Tax=Pleurodeles waltl TaxID=8319 RepID=A0AAV7NKM2_PLEWA|nr:hypothetical protein NDU88_003148 [Pleurodeles waltl]
MAAGRENKRIEAAQKLFVGLSNKHLLEVGNGHKDEQAIKQLWDNLWKISKREQARWLEATTLQKYLECNRIPRVLRIFTSSNTVNPDPGMTDEWMTNNHNCSVGMLKLLIKYARKEVEKLAAQIDASTQILKAKCTPDVFEKETSRLNERLNKLEEEIMAKKQRKFQRDEADYEQGRILTFGQRFDHLRSSSEIQDVRQLITRQQATTTEGAQASISGMGTQQECS